MLRNLLRALAYTIVAIALTQCSPPPSTAESGMQDVTTTDNAATQQDTTPQPVWIDADLAVGMKNIRRPGYSDVDDGYAILQLLQSPKVHITGISAVYGNTTIENAYPLCQEMVSKYSTYPISVSKGAGEPIDIKKVESNAAVEAMAASLRKGPQKILAIGPATNVGLLLMLYPEVSENILEVILVAGRRTAQDYFEAGDGDRRFQDLNFDLDNAAFQVLLDSGVPVTLCPFEISHKVWIKSEDLDYLEAQTPAAKWLAQSSRPWLAQWQQMGADGFNPFDVLASHYLLYPEDIIAEDLYATMQLHPDDTKGDQQTIYKNYLLCTDNKSGSAVTYCHDVVPDYHNKLLATFNR